MGRTIETISARIALAIADHSATTPIPSNCASIWLPMPMPSA
jgi:hypothetical protein